MWGYGGGIRDREVLFSNIRYSNYFLVRFFRGGVSCLPLVVGWLVQIDSMLVRYRAFLGRKFQNWPPSP